MKGIIRGSISILSGAQKMAISVRIAGAQLWLALRGTVVAIPSPEYR
jgi:hypothetical protein